jgi:hypothetical protein
MEKVNWLHKGGHMLDFTRVWNKEISFDELCAGLTLSDLHDLTDEMVNNLLKLIAEAKDGDVTFLPVDLLADDPFAATLEEFKMPWTLGHVIVHTTASAEEGAAQSAALARGVPITGRSRYEVHWQTVNRITQLRDRLEESRRIRHAYLNTWPDHPHLELTYTANYPGAQPRNAITMFVGGLSHEASHLGQIADILQQARKIKD